MLDVRNILKTKKQFWGALKKYSKCYNSIRHFKLQPLHVCQIIISPYSIYVHIEFQVVLSIGRIFENIFYCSITKYYLSIEQCFLDNKFASSINDTGFDCYSVCGGENTGFKVIFHIKYYKGCILNPYLTPFEMNNELIYAYGSVTSFITLSSLKERKLPQSRKIPLYHMFDSYCIISLNFYFIIISIVFVIVWFFGTILYSDL